METKEKLTAKQHKQANVYIFAGTIDQVSAFDPVID